MIKQKYLPHIDGLRAISVILVILFHFMIGPFTGGYIGVDVFFTISGFLIIGSIVSQLEAGNFSALDFWQRRIRRLIPAILATLSLSFIAGFLIMSPSDFEGLAKQSLFALFSLINFTLLGTVDYFDQTSPDKPLLHFWSLAVEEQFYILFPIIALSLFFFLKKNQNYKAVMIGVLITLSIASVFAAEHLIKNGQNLTAYYMMPTRFSQLALGGVLAIAFQFKRFEKFLQKIPQIIHALIMISGFIAIGYVATKFTVNTTFPGLNSALPTYGALAILMSGGRNTLKPILENPIASYIGKLSYSLYLVHWPVWAFLAYYLNRQPENIEVICAIITSIGLSILIYHTIEKPFRFGKTFKNRAIYKFLIPCLTVFAYCSGLVIHLNGIPQRLEKDRMDFVKDARNYHRVNFGGRGYDGNHNELGDPNAEPDFLIIGDSKARQFAYGLNKYLTENNRKAILLSADGCPMIREIVRYIDGKPYQKCIDRIDDIIKLSHSSTLPIISIRSWSNNKKLTYKGKPFSVTSAGGHELYAKLHIEFHENLLRNSPSTRKIYLIGSNQGFRSTSSIADCLSRPAWLGLYCLKSNNFDVQNYKLPRIERLIKRASEAITNISYIPMVDIFCETGTCSQVSSDGKVIFSDPAHISKTGSYALSERLLLFTQLVPGVETIPDPVIKWVPEPIKVIKVTDITPDLIKSIESVATALEESPETYRGSLIEKIGDLMTNENDRNKLVNALWKGVTINQNRVISAELSESFAIKYEDSISIYRIGFAYYSGQGKIQNLSKALQYMEHPSQSKNTALKLRRAKIYLDKSFEGYDRDIGLKLLNESVQLNVKGAAELLDEVTK